MPFRFLVLIVAAAAAVLCASPALAAPSKPFEMVVAPEHEFAGVTDNTYTVTLTNKTKTQQLGSADITVPSAITIVARDGIGGSGNVLELRDLGVPPGGSVTITIGLRMPCVAGSYAWTVEAKQSNDFSALPGNALGPVSGTLSTVVQGSCSLRFVHQPAGAEKKTQIRADAFVPASAQLVTVEALDGSPAPQRLTWFTRTIDLRLLQSAPGSLTPSPASSAAVEGLASFSNLSIDQSGNYNLRATTTVSGFTASVSSAFQIIDDVGECKPSNCHAGPLGVRSRATLDGTPAAGSGFALLSLNLGRDPKDGTGCAGYEPPSSEYFEFQLFGVDGDKTLVLDNIKEVMKKRGPSSLEICLAVPGPGSFIAKDGLTADPFDYDGNPLTGTNGKEGFADLLRDCGSPVVKPCVDDRSPTTGGGARITALAGPGDPRVH